MTERPNQSNHSVSKIQGRFYPLQHDEWLFVTKKLTNSELLILYYLRTLEPFGDKMTEVTTKSISTNLNLSQRTVQRALKELVFKGYLPESYLPDFIQVDDKERQIRDRLHQELGGQTEVTTGVGRIDLLTDIEVIEIKGISDCPSVLGQILAYAAFFPNQQERIHLFGKQDLAKLALFLATCSEFGIAVTFEEM
jgi:DNA-binding MarR family transcriptional regulator